MWCRSTSGPYVWKREDQWEPLWDEAAISRRTDELLRIARDV